MTSNSQPSLGLAGELVSAAQALGISAFTAIQLQAIPAILTGEDVLATSKTGSGKTAAFVLPMLQRLQEAPLSSPRRVRALVLVPTRELAAQVGEVVRRLASHLTPRLKTAVVFGGVSINPQMMHLRGGADVVIATPGRLLDLATQNAVRLSDLQILVVDEADRLLELGFADELRQILALLPPQRQNLFFSATFEPAAQKLANDLLNNPTRIDIAETLIENDENVDASTSAAPWQGILQRAIAVDEEKRTPLLRYLVQQNQWQQVLVFVASKYTAELVANKLYKTGIFATAFHGDLSQGARTQVLQEFKAERWEVLVTTDLAARGIDIHQLPVVLNYDLPRSATDYVHRVGRTGRAGANGLAISFITPATERHFQLIEKRQHLSLPREQIPGFEWAQVDSTLTTSSPVDDAGGIKGKRPSKKDKLRAAGLAVAGVGLIKS